jgi:[ribosomal protein S18]-alanine N-acetyltransferase
MSQVKLIPLAEEYGRQICSWHYPAPYDIYNWPSWDEMIRNQAEFADPSIREAQYLACVDVDGALMGFAQLFPMQNVTRLGLGLRPDLCNHGIGTSLVEAIVRTASELKPENEIDLEVVTWNHRAIKVYERAGFTITDTYERPARNRLIEVHCMVYGK